jgi:hypothetical protein
LKGRATDDPGRQPRFYALAITTALSLPAVFRLALRQTDRRRAARRMSLTSRSDGGGLGDFWFICMFSVNTISQKSFLPQLLKSVS